MMAAQGTCLSTRFWPTLPDHDPLFTTRILHTRYLKSQSGQPASTMRGSSSEVAYTVTSPRLMRDREAGSLHFLAESPLGLQEMVGEVGDTSITPARSSGRPVLITLRIPTFTRPCGWAGP